MDENEAGGGGYGGDPSEQFHRTEAISAVADEGFLGEEDDDYEDLYNDVNVGENFLQSLRRNEDNLGHRNEELQEDNKAKLTPTPPPPPPPSQQPLVEESGGAALPDEGASSRVPGRVEGYQNMGFRGNSNVPNVTGVGRGAEHQLVVEVKFFDERASGKSKGYCQVEFYDPAAATACKEGMNGHVFNGRPCVVAYASPYTVKRMGEAQVNRNQPQMGPAAVNQPRRGPGDLPNKPGGVGNNMATGGSHQGGGDNNGRGFGRGNWGRGNNQGGMGNRGPIGPMRNRAGGMGVRGLTGNGFGQGIGAAPPLLHPQAMMGQGFDPTFGGPMGRMGGYGGFPGGPAAPFSGMLSSFGPVGNVGLPGVAPHVNPAFFGRGMPMNGMGMMPNPGVEGPNMGMWSDPNMGGWGGDEHGGRAGESSYGEEAASDHLDGEGSQERGPWPNAFKEKDRGSERDWSGSSDRRYKDDRGAGYERDAPREKDVGRDSDWSERRNRDDKDVGRGRQRERDRDRERS
ncbi:hypothetical protein DH2020_035715 [Rehmannia glutinosa]|uniref:RRM domain-containing protein n=1 Tax=Rehmannia glutinosa TaxID=99300 RepID=A0ABR0V8G0_REHGL